MKFAKIRKYFFLGGIWGPCILTFLMLFYLGILEIKLAAVWYSGISNVICAFPFFMVFCLVAGFIPSGIFGIHSFLLLDKYYHKISSRKLILYLAIIGVGYSLIPQIVDRIIMGMKEAGRWGNWTLSHTISYILEFIRYDLFCRESGAKSFGLSPFSLTMLKLISGILTSLLIFKFFTKRDADLNRV